MFNKKSITALASIFLISVVVSGCSFNETAQNYYSNFNKLLAQQNININLNKKTSDVPQTYEEWVAKNGPDKTRENVTKRTTPSSSSNSVNNRKPENRPQFLGEEIPSWVFDDTTPSDDYYNVINSYNNVVFFSYADCPIGRGIKNKAINAINKTGTSGKFVLNADLHPQGSSIAAHCRKGVSQCAINYLLDNCMTQVCIINPRQRRIVFTAPEEGAIITQLNRLKNNW